MVVVKRHRPAINFGLFFGYYDIEGCFTLLDFGETSLTKSGAAGGSEVCIFDQRGDYPTVLI